MPTRCDHRDCEKKSSYGKAGTNKAELCAEHARYGMVNVRGKRCGHSGCTTQPSYGKAGTNKAELCAEHARDGMVNVVDKRCSHSGCTTRPSYGKAGINKAELCAEHARDGMVNVRSKRCGHSGCSKHVPHGSAVRSRMREFCSQHAEGGLLPLKRSRPHAEGGTTSGRGQDGSIIGSTPRPVGTAESSTNGAPSTHPVASSGGGSTADARQRVLNGDLSVPSLTVAASVAGATGDGRAAAASMKSSETGDT